MSFTWGFSFAMVAVGPVVLSHYNGTRSAFGFWLGPFYMVWHWRETPA